MDGSLLVANADAIERLVTSDTPGVVKLDNKGTEPVTVEILTCRNH
ncbi:hypothetical protein [Streptomyces sp. NPDC053427]